MQLNSSALVNCAECKSWIFKTMHIICLTHIETLIIWIKFSQLIKFTYREWILITKTLTYLQPTASSYYHSTTAVRNAFNQKEVILTRTTYVQIIRVCKRNAYMYLRIHLNNHWYCDCFAGHEIQTAHLLHLHSQRFRKQIYKWCSKWSFCK